MSGRLPDFVIIGAQKAGTTWLGYRMLEQPDLFLPRPLEMHFFDLPENYAKGYDWYSKPFASAPAESIVGEKTPDYFWTVRPLGMGPNDIPARMHRALPNAKLIVVLRDPVKRAISALNHAVRAREISPFVDPDTVLGEALDPEADSFGLIGKGYYLMHLQNFLRFYPREQMHVVFFENEVIQEPQRTIDRVMAFLGRGPAKALRPRARPENQRMNSRLGLVLNYYAPKLGPLISAFDRAMPTAAEIAPSPGCRNRLYEHYAPHNRALFAFLGLPPKWQLS